MAAQAMQDSPFRYSSILGFREMTSNVEVHFVILVFFSSARIVNEGSTYNAPRAPPQRDLSRHRSPRGSSTERGNSTERHGVKLDRCSEIGDVFTAP